MVNPRITHPKSRFFLNSLGWFDLGNEWQAAGLLGSHDSKPVPSRSHGSFPLETLGSWQAATSGRGRSIAIWAQVSGNECYMHGNFLWRKWWQTRRQLWDNSSFQPKVSVLYFGRGPLKHCSMTCQTRRPLGGLELVCRCRKTSCLLAAHWYLNMPQGPQGVALSTSKKEPDSMHQDWARRSSVPSTSSTLILMHQGDLLPPSFPDPDLSWLLPRMPQVMALVPEHVRKTPTSTGWSVFAKLSHQNCHNWW